MIQIDEWANEQDFDEWEMDYKGFQIGDDEQTTCLNPLTPNQNYIQGPYPEVEIGSSSDDEAPPVPQSSLLARENLELKERVNSLIQRDKTLEMTNSNLKKQLVKIPEIDAIIPPKVTKITLRILGNGHAEGTFSNVWYEIVSHRDIPETVVFSNDVINISIDTTTQHTTVYNKTTGIAYPFFNNAAISTMLTNIQLHSDTSATFTVRNGRYEFQAKLELTSDELNVSYEGDPEAPVSPPTFPQGFRTHKGDRMIIASGEGLSFPSGENVCIREGCQKEYTHYVYKLSMPLFGMTNGEYSIMYVVDTPDDSNVLMMYDSSLQSHYYYLEFFKQKGTFGYTRKFRILFVYGDHFAMDKRYRKIAQEKGLLVPFTEKVKTKPNIAKLIGSANFMFYEPFGINRIDLYKEIQSLGIQQILDSAAPISLVEYINNNMTDILPGKYDIYQNTGNPEHYEKGWIDWNGNWPDAYPDGVIVNSANQLVTLSSVVNKSDPSKNVDIYATCDMMNIQYAKERYEEQMNETGYVEPARYVDGATCTIEYECYNPNHLMNRRDSIKYRLELLKYFHDKKLVIGSEDGKDIAIPYCDYFLGIMSPGAFRVIGSDTAESIKHYLDEAPQSQTRVMTNESIRIPLFELVYHGCAISYWGGDDHELAQPVSELTGYAEMTDHKYLTSDKTVQQTIFSNRVRVTVNFGSSTYAMQNGKIVEPMGSVVEENYVEDEMTGGVPGWIIGVIVAVVIVIVACVLVVMYVIKGKDPLKEQTNE
ncbi:Carbohydrate binding domain-containing protein [Histomonas meleagridis]|uniref:Carbohydrate binding domain-containing protein n=1 Tax=Histomonas meleagridis TaxID=135588 RepID=UPI003559D158|nr:Carbohydrate binding domain-containing protein [Histomonas meleagridis]KAH0802096.1 Carbohydrate binding domain-containing protein [Histomonas meleagridis]